MFSGMSPEITPLRTCLTHAGQRLSVSRGKPSGGAVRSYDLRSGSAAHDGWIDWPSGIALFTAWNAFHPRSAILETAFEPFRPFPFPSPRLKLSLNIINLGLRHTYPSL